MSHNLARQSTAGQIRALFQGGVVAGLSDGQLLERFVTRGGQSAELAFAALVEKHGPTVLNVCLGVLRDRHDAEDAFQATFLILARRADTIRNRDSVASWLHGVALRVASEARSAAARRRLLEGRASAEPNRSSDGDDPDEIAPMLLDELRRLPSRYREPVILCYLEGLTHVEAAQRLGWPVGTVKSRLARGKVTLKRRLTRRGLAPGAIPAVWPGLTTVPAALAEATLKAAAHSSIPTTVISSAVAALVKGTIRAMFITRLKFATFSLLTVGVLCAGALAGGDRRDRPTSDPRRHDDHATVVALEGRVRELERKLDELTPAPQASFDPELNYKIRPRFECLVEKVLVKAGQKVKKNAPLAELFSGDLASAKNAYLSKLTIFTNSQRFITLRQRLVDTGGISQQLWVETQSEYESSNLEMTAAGDRLALYGQSQSEIDAYAAEVRALADQDANEMTTRAQE